MQHSKGIMRLYLIQNIMPKNKKGAKPRIKQAQVKAWQPNAQQKLFCELFVTKEFFGNGVQAYIEAYNVDTSKKGSYDAARVSASRLLTNANILKFINGLLDDAGLNDIHVDKQLLFLITQNADYSSKVAAIREYNKLKARIVTKHEVAGNIEIQDAIDYSKLSESTLRELLSACKSNENKAGAGK